MKLLASCLAFAPAAISIASTPQPHVSVLPSPPAKTTAVTARRAASSRMRVDFAGAAFGHEI